VEARNQDLGRKGHDSDVANLTGTPLLSASACDISHGGQGAVTQPHVALIWALIGGSPEQHFALRNCPARQTIAWRLNSSAAVTVVGSKRPFCAQLAARRIFDLLSAEAYDIVPYY
jgi:hypothetical protein